MKKRIQFTLFLLSLVTVTARAQWVITRFAGSYISAGLLGDGGPATSALLQSPTDIAVDSVGNIYIADFSNNVIRKVDTMGIINTIAGTSAAGFSGDGGPATNAELNGPYALALDKHGNLFFADGYNHVVRKINAAGVISTIAGDHFTANYTGDGGPATLATLNNPVGVALDDTGNLYIADDHNNVIRKVDTAGIITTFAGDSTAGHAGNGGPATSALLNLPLGVAADKHGNLFIADAVNNVIRKVDNAGIMHDYVGYDTVHGFSGDGGPATSAMLSYPVHLTIDDSDNLYFADALNSVVRKVNAAGIITTIAGDGTVGYAGDNGDPLAAQLAVPHAVAVDKQHRIYIADRGNNAIRRIGPASTKVISLMVPEESLSVYPNPVSEGRFAVRLNGDGVEKADVVIVNVLGQTIRTLTTSTNKTEQISLDTPAGIYFISATTGRGKWTKRIVMN